MERIRKFPGDHIYLGRQGEHLSRQIVFDISAWEEKAGPQGSVQLLYRRPGESVPYPVELEREGGGAVWSVTGADTALSGSGGGELRYCLGEQVVKSAVSVVTVEAAMGAAGQAPQVPGSTLPGGSGVKLDDTLTRSGCAAEAKAVGQAVEGVSAKVGDLSRLNTADKSSLVNAVNEILAAGGGSSDSSQNVTVTGTTDINTKKWFGKKIVVDGSSITKGETGNTLPTWGRFLKDMFALDAVHNHAVGGTGWFFGGNSHVIDRVDEYEDDADAVILMGDYNGIYAYTSNTGTIADEAAADGSYYAKLKYLAEKLIAKYPLCPIIWVVEPPRAGVGETSGGKTPMNYNSIYALQSKVIEEVADCYGFTHCNLMKNTIFRPWIQENYDVTTSDGTHPWNNIQRTMAQVIAETMKRTPLIYNESYVVTPDASAGGDTGDDTGGSGGSGGDNAGGDNPGGETEVTLTGITAAFTQGDAVIKTTDELDVLKNYLRVVATYSDLSEAVVTDYTLSGELAEGTSTITVTYQTATTTFDVAVTPDDGSVTVALGDVIDESLIGKYFANNTFAITARDGMRISRYLPVKGGSKITLSAGLQYPNLTNCDIRFYDAEGAAIPGVSVNLEYGDTETIAPENAVTFRIGFDSNDDGKTITYFPA